METYTYAERGKVLVYFFLLFFFFFFFEEYIWIMSGIRKGCFCIFMLQRRDFLIFVTNGKEYCQVCVFAFFDILRYS